LKKALPTVPYYYNRMYTMGIFYVSPRAYLSAVCAYIGYERIQKTED
jgi:hypothetical protein